MPAALPKLRFTGGTALYRSAVALTTVLCLVFATTAAKAQGLIRDAEIEQLVRDYAKPILKVAGLSSRNIEVHLVNDRSFNAFVVDGHNIFINVGALMEAKTPNAIIGVLAHETGHITGGHLAGLRATIERAQTASAILQILGLVAVGASALSGAGAEAGQAGTAAILGGTSALQRNILSYRRSQESSADQAALVFLKATHQSPKGMLDTFEYLAQQSLGALQYVDPYLQSHPMPRERISQLRNTAEASPYYDRKDPPRLQLRHDMMRAKLSGFIDTPQIVFNKYPQSDQSLPAKYARAIATQRSAGVDAFLPRVDALIQAVPNYPYFHELKGQFLLESARPKQAVAPLQKAVELAPDAGPIRILLAKAMLATNEKRYVDPAINHLRHALVEENHSAAGYEQLAIAYGHKIDTASGAAQRKYIAEAELASAQRYFYQGKLKDAKAQAERAKKGFSPHSASWVKADDITTYKPPDKN